MKLCGVPGLLLVVGCQPRLAATPKPEPLSRESGPQPIHAAASAAPSARPGASIELAEAGADILKWNFLVRGLPAVDVRTGSILIANVSRDASVPSLGLSLLWLRPGQRFPFRVWSVLDSNDPDSSLDNRGLADGTRVRTRDANEMLGSLELRPTIPCAMEHITWCTHPQRLACSELSAEWQGDQLRWRFGVQTSKTVLDWGAEATKTGEVETNTCIEEAHLDAEARRIIARVTTSVRLPNGYSWTKDSEWRVISLAAPPLVPVSRKSGQRPTTDATAPPSAKPRASITFAGNGPDLRKWDFLVRGLPAVDLRTGAIVVGDLSRSLGPANTLGLSLLWLRPGQKSRLRVWSVLDKFAASSLLYDDDPQPGAAQKIAARALALAEGVQERTRDANEMLGSLELRPTLPCAVQRRPEWCAHPQRLACSQLSAELQGDQLRWRLGAETRETVLGWGVAPMQIGDGPPKEIITCIEEAHWDPETSLIVARVWDSCKERGGDVCVGESKWRVIPLR